MIVLRSTARRRARESQRLLPKALKRGKKAARHGDGGYEFLNSCRQARRRSPFSHVSGGRRREAPDGGKERADVR